MAASLCAGRRATAARSARGSRPTAGGSHTSPARPARARSICVRFFCGRRNDPSLDARRNAARLVSRWSRAVLSRPEQTLMAVAVQAAGARLEFGTPVPLFKRRWRTPGPQSLSACRRRAAVPDQRAGHDAARRLTRRGRRARLGPRDVRRARQGHRKRPVITCAPAT